MREPSAKGVHVWIRFGILMAGGEAGADDAGNAPRRRKRQTEGA